MSLVVVVANNDECYGSYCSRSSSDGMDGTKREKTDVPHLEYKKHPQLGGLALQAKL